VTHTYHDAGRAHIREGCYCRVGEGGQEIIKIGRLHTECEVLLMENMDPATTHLHVSHHQAGMDVRRTCKSRTIYESRTTYESRTSLHILCVTHSGMEVRRTCVFWMVGLFCGSFLVCIGVFSHV